MSVVVVAGRLVNEPERRLDRYIVRDPLFLEPRDYWGALACRWSNPALTIVNVEHDHPITDALVDELLLCEHPLCTFGYELYFPTTHQHTPHYAQSVSLAGEHPPIEDVSRFTARGIRWIDEGEEWADYSGLGFCKITPTARLQPLPPNTWAGVEMSVNASVNTRWHVHWPAIEHYHR